MAGTRSRDRGARRPGAASAYHGPSFAPTLCCRYPAPMSMHPMPPLPEAPARDAAAYRFWIEERVRYADLDSLGHVNNVAYAVYFEGGRVEFLRATGVWDPADNSVTTVVARSEIDFLREVLYPAVVRVGTRCVRLGHTSFVLDSAAFVDGECVSVCRAVQVRWDVATRGPAPLTPANRERLAAT